MVLITAEVERVQGIPGGRLLQFIAPATDEAQSSFIIRTGQCVELQGLHAAERLDHIANLHRVNDIKGINKFFCTVNNRLRTGGTFVGCMETLEQRRDRLYRKFPPPVAQLYYALDFVFKRVFPKFKPTKRIYMAITGGRNRALSKSEVLGRLVYCGFSIEKVETIDNKLFFKARKQRAPLSEPEPSTGILLRINRIGRHGRPIIVYKLRTMHPYAQYIQAYVYEQNHLSPGGKLRDDFRVTKWGRWMRRFWIDEIPMLYNILRGDLKLVGVRPLSEHYLSLYTPEIKEMRVQGKPGLIPPFYADMPATIEEIMASEMRYMHAYMHAPLTTDLEYCMRAVGNIFLRKARSA